ncbi:MAG: extracellular solute-binding protein [Myxococcales bacterium]|nr:extracellular solute-binding protein [Myxococcales bacterium]
MLTRAPRRTARPSVRPSARPSVRPSARPNARAASRVSTPARATARTTARCSWLRFAPVFALLLLAWPARAAEPLRLWHAYRGAEERALAAVLASFTEAPVETLAVPYDAYAAKLAAAIPLGDGPDLFIDAHERLGDYQAKGLVRPVVLDPTLFEPQALGAVTFKGGILGVPLSQKCVALFRNDALAHAPPASLESLSASLHAPLDAHSYLLAYESRSAYYHAAFLGAFGGRLLDEGDRFGFTGAPAEASLALAKSLLDRGLTPPGADGALVTQLFRSGRAAFAISGPWLASELDGASIRFHVSPLPILAATGARMRPLLTVESVMLTPRGAANDAVRSLANHLGSRAAAELRMRDARTVSARADVTIAESDHVLLAFAEAARLAEPMPATVAMRAVWEPTEKALRKVLSGAAEPALALREAEWRFEDVRRPPPPSRSPTLLVVVLTALALTGAFMLVRRARSPEFRARLRESRPAYGYVAHAVVAVGLLVFVPLIAGAALSVTAGGFGEERYVGLAHFISILTARGRPLLSAGSFYVVLLVTVAWTIVNVGLHLAIGMALGVLLSRPTLRFRALYRVLLIVPWAVPSYVTALAWKGMFHRQFGAVTALVDTLASALGVSFQPIDWFSRFSTAFAANLVTNVWLGFPFMMVVTLAALTNVPKDVLEAAEIDGASRWQRFRLVTLPIIKPTMLPAATLGAVWTFNMFNVVFLVSGGEPDGQTDTLVSEAYRWAFTRQAQVGYAAAYAVLIFLLLFAGTKLPELARARWRRSPILAASNASEAAS